MDRYGQYGASVPVQWCVLPFTSSPLPLEYFERLTQPINSGKLVLFSSDTFAKSVQHSGTSAGRNKGKYKAQL
jgi:hypothetical protein